MTENFIKEYLQELYKLGYRYLVTNSNGKDSVFKAEPEKCDDIWCDETLSGEDGLPFTLGLTSREDEKPKSIEKFLGIKDALWFQVPVDTKILVSTDGIDWYKRYFAKYEGGKVYAWNNGFTSWTAVDVVDWYYAKLAEE